MFVVWWCVPFFSLNPTCSSPVSPLSLERILVRSLAVVSCWHVRLVQCSCSCCTVVSHLSSGLVSSTFLTTAKPQCISHIACTMSSLHQTRTVQLLCCSDLVSFSELLYCMTCLFSFSGSGSLFRTSLCTFSCSSLYSSSQYPFHLTFNTSRFFSSWKQYYCLW